MVDFFFFGPKRREVLNGLVWAICVIYFGTLTAAVWLCPRPYDWRRQSISWLLYPRNDPGFHLIASAGIALAGLLIIPVTGYIRESLTSACSSFARFGGCILSGGAVLLILAGLIVSHPYVGHARFPRLHEMLARGAALALGAGMVSLWLAVLRAWFSLSARGILRLRPLVISWSLLLIPAILVLILRLLAYAERRNLLSVLSSIQGRSLWHLGFWEWIGSGAVFLFLLSSAIFLPHLSRESESQMSRPRDSSRARSMRAFDIPGGRQ